MMKVYIVTNNCGFGELDPESLIRSVFLSEELAKAHIDSYPSSYSKYFDIIERDVVGE